MPLTTELRWDGKYDAHGKRVLPPARETAVPDGRDRQRIDAQPSDAVPHAARRPPLAQPPHLGRQEVRPAGPAQQVRRQGQPHLHRHPAELLELGEQPLDPVPLPVGRPVAERLRGRSGSCGCRDHRPRRPDRSAGPPLRRPRRSPCPPPTRRTPSPAPALLPHRLQKRRSLAWPGATATAIAVSSSAAVRMILLVNPPRLRPRPWAVASPFFLTPRRRAGGRHDGRIDEHAAPRPGPGRRSAGRTAAAGRRRRPSGGSGCTRRPGGNRRAGCRGTPVRATYRGSEEHPVGEHRLCGAVAFGLVHRRPQRGPEGVRDHVPHGVRVS